MVYFYRISSSIYSCIAFVVDASAEKYNKKIKKKKKMKKRVRYTQRVMKKNSSYLSKKYKRKKFFSRTKGTKEKIERLASINSTRPRQIYYHNKYFLRNSSLARTHSLSPSDLENFILF